MPPDDVFRQAELQAEPADFVLEQVAQRLDQLEAKSCRQAADVVVQLDRVGRAVGAGAAFDHVGIERALGQESGAVDLARLRRAKHSMNAWPMRRRFSCGSVTPASAARNRSLGLDDVQIGFEVAAELVRRLGLFVLAQQAVVDQDARELRGRWRWIEQRRDDGRIDAAREAADHAVLADPLADARDGSVGEIAAAARCRVQPADVVQESCAADRVAARRVRDFGMKLQAVERRSCFAGAWRHTGRCRSRSGAEVAGDRCRPDRRGSSRPDRACPRARRRRTVGVAPISISARPNSRFGRRLHVGRRAPGTPAALP